MDMFEIRFRCSLIHEYTSSRATAGEQQHRSRYRLSVSPAESYARERECEIQQCTACRPSAPLQTSVELIPTADATCTTHEAIAVASSGQDEKNQTFKSEQRPTNEKLARPGGLDSRRALHTAERIDSQT